VDLRLPALQLAAKTGTCEYFRMSENVLFCNDVKRLRRLRALAAAVSCLMVIGFIFDLSILIIGYHPANRVFQIGWLPVYALWAWVWFQWFRSYSTRITTVVQKTNRPEPQPQ